MSIFKGFRTELPSFCFVDMARRSRQIFRHRYIHRDILVDHQIIRPVNLLHNGHPEE
jgi:hypothetical protein